MDLRRVRVWEWLTGVAGLVLLVSLFLPWYGVEGSSATGWESLSVIDVVLAAVALAGMSVPVVAGTQRTPAVPQALTQLIVPIALVGAVLALIRLLDVPS